MAERQLREGFDVQQSRKESGQGTLHRRVPLDLDQVALPKSHPWAVPQGPDNPHGLRTVTLQSVREGVEANNLPATLNTMYVSAPVRLQW